MSYYYFQIDGESDQLVLDTTAIDMTLPDISRAFEKIELFNNSAYITGDGNFRSGELSFTARYRKGTDNTAWNTLRYAVARWIGLPRTKSLYFYIVDSDGTTFRTRVYPAGYNGESYRTLGISGDVTFRFIMRDGYYEKQTATTTSQTLTTDTLELMTVTNSGLLPAPPLIEYVPSTTATQLQVSIAEGYGFQLTGSWSSGTVLQYDCKTGKAYVDGNETTGLLASGSIFTLAPGSNTLYIYADEGEIEVSINERYI